MSSPILDGFLLGLSIAMPFGPVSLSCVQSSLAGGPRSGMASGLGATSAHAVFAVTAATSVGAFIASTGTHHAYASLLSAAVLIGLGLRMLHRTRLPGPIQPARAGRTAYLSGLTLALSNPMTILPYLALAATMAHETGSPATPMALMVAGDIAAILGWYMLLSLGAAHLRSRIGQAALQRLHFGTAAILICLGVWAAVK